MKGSGAAQLLQEHRLLRLTELAKGWLDGGGTNRTITRRRIDALAAAILRGE